MTNIFLRDEKGRRPVFGDVEKFQTDPHWRDLVLFLRILSRRLRRRSRRQPSDRLDRSRDQVDATERGNAYAQKAQAPTVTGRGRGLILQRISQLTSPTGAIKVVCQVAAQAT